MVLESSPSGSVPTNAARASIDALLALMLLFIVAASLLWPEIQSAISFNVSKDSGASATMPAIASATVLETDPTPVPFRVAIAVSLAETRPFRAVSSYPLDVISLRRAVLASSICFFTEPSTSAPPSSFEMASLFSLTWPSSRAFTSSAALPAGS